eukprot:scaffold89590_cov42-Phaeocystis_antarctica.AAC.2
MQVAGLQAWRLPISESRREPLTQTVGWHAWGLAGRAPVPWAGSTAGLRSKLVKSILNLCVPPLVQ